MKIAIYGASEITSLIAKEFHQVHEITVIDKEENKTEEFSRLDIRFISCEALTIDVLKNINIKNADTFIACSTNDEKNILACMTAKRLCPIKTICFVSKEEYKKQIDEIIDLLDGKTEKILKELETQMKEASKKLNFEEAAYIRDRKQAIERVSEKQKVSNISENNIDVIGIAKSEIEVCIEIFFVRGSKMIGREHYFFTELKDMTDSEILSGFIKQ